MSSGIAFCSFSRASASLRKATVSVNVPSASMPIVPPRISGRASLSASIGCDMNVRNRSGSLSRPWITWTKPASSEPPPRNIIASSQSWKVTSPSKQAAIFCHHSPCSGRSALRFASSFDSNLTTATNWSSSVRP